MPIEVEEKKVKFTVTSAGVKSLCNVFLEPDGFATI